MLVSDIIANGRLLSDVPNTLFYTDAEALFAVQLSWKDIYSMLANGGDDYFTTSLYVTSASLTADPNRANTYFYNLPTDFYRLRLLQYQGDGGNQYWPVERMNPSNFGNTQNTPAYRIVGRSSTALSNGGQVSIYTPHLHPNWAIWYIPAPATLATNDDLSYPLSMVPEIMAYQLAVEIRRKQNIDYKDKQARRDELIFTMKKQITRDENRAETPKNTFSSGMGAYI
jgi:hypothetical protein